MRLDKFCNRECAMPNMTATVGRWGPVSSLAVLLGTLGLAGCTSSTTVSATGNTAAQYTHVFVTLNAIWFNTSSTAAVTDNSWTEFTLATPITVDLVTLSNGALSQIASDLKLSSGTYKQVMLFLADSTAALSSSAESAGAASNDEVDYIDTSAVAHTVPLAIVNAAQGISVSTSVVVGSGDGLGSLSDSSAESSTASSTSSSTSVSSSTSLIVDFDATRDLVPISLSGSPAFALNPHPTLYNAGSAGTIQGAVSLTSVSTLTEAGYPDVQVAAESLSSDGTRHVVVATTGVETDGTFILYPLSTVTGAPSTYDLVIHGPNIQTVIIKSVPVTNSSPGSAAAVLGTLTLTSATPYAVNVNSTSPAAVKSSSVGFYQTLPLDSEVPYLIEQRVLDPTSGLFASAQDLSNGPLQYGTYASGTVTLTAVNPSQGAATYAIGAINPAYGEATLGTTVTAPTDYTTTQQFTMNTPPVPAGSTANALQGTLTVGTSAYDNAVLLLTYNGMVVAAAPLTSYLSSSQSTLSLSALAPGGSAGSTYAAGIYYGEIWAWSSSNPTGTLTRIASSAPIDMSAGNATGVALTID